MKKFKLFLIIVFSVISETIVAQSEWNIVNQTYNNNDYIIKSSESVYVIKNKKFEFSEVTCDIEFDGETEKQFDFRREPVCRKIYETVNSVFDFSNIPVSLDEVYRLLMVCFFDSTTKDYVGAYFIFDTEVKDYFTLEKINLAEEKLSAASINAGSTNLLNPEKKYFTIEVGIPIGN